MFGLFLIITALVGFGLASRAILMAKHRAHPRCARCAYDLGGRPAAGHSIDCCPECGADLRGPASIVTNRRSFRLGIWLVVLAAAMLLTAPHAYRVVCTEGAAAWRYVPEAVLIWTARIEETNVGAQALREVERRLEGGTMSTRGVQRVLAVVLPRDEHDDAWSLRPSWNAAARLAIARGQPALPVKLRYEQELFESGLVLRLRREAGTRVPFMLYAPTGAAALAVESARLGDREVQVPPDPDGGAWIRPQSAMLIGFVEIPPDTPPGNHQLVMIVRGDTTAIGNRTGVSMRDWLAEVRGTVVVEAPVSVHPGE